MYTKEIVDTMLRESTLEVPKRRAYSAQLKAQVLQQCSQEGASASGVALSHSLNANMVHRWIREERQRVLVEAAEASGQQFVPLQLQDATVIEAEAATTPASSEAGRSSSAIHIEVRRGSAVVAINWPTDCASSCGVWLRDWLR